MTLYNIEYQCMVPEWGHIEMDFEEDLSRETMIQEAVDYLSDTYPEAEDVLITEVQAVV